MIKDEGSLQFAVPVKDLDFVAILVHKRGVVVMLPGLVPIPVKEINVSVVGR